MRPQSPHKFQSESSPASEISAQQIEAARYAVLRRMASSLRHRMVRPVQPLGLIYSVISRQLSAAEPNLRELRAHADRLKGVAESVMVEYHHMAGWLTPDADTLTELGAGVTECVGLLATNLYFQGFRLVDEVDEPPVRVRHDALRMVLLAAILAVTDALTEPATLTLTASVDANTGVVTLSLQLGPWDKGRVEDHDDSYRKLAWADVQALAASTGVTVSRQDDRVTIRLPIEPAAAAG